MSNGPGKPRSRDVAWILARICRQVALQAQVHTGHFPPRWFRWLLLLPVLCMIASCATSTPAVHYDPPAVIAPPPPPAPKAPQAAEKPRETVTHASWYGRKFAGRKTASGEKFSPHEMTAASKDLPIGARVVVTNMMNGHSVKVRINDCGPLQKGRKIDLSMRAAHQLGIIHDGVALVRIRVLEVPRGATTCGFI